VVSLGNPKDNIMTPEEEYKHLKKKIEQVILDIEMFRQQGNADKKLEVMMSYQEYLEDELKMLGKKLNGVDNG
jgi:metallophosphoesterase superfamily enzyme